MNGYSSFERLGLVVNLVVSSVASFVVSLAAHCFDLAVKSYYLADLIVDLSLHIADESSLSHS